MFSSRRRSQEWSMAVCGDVMLGRGVATAMSQNGMLYPFEQWLPILNLRILLGNLESPLSPTRHSYTRKGSG